MKVTFLMIGKTINSNLSILTDDYLQRIKHYLAFDVHVIPELKNKNNLSVAEQKQKEGELILKFLKPTDFVVLLDEKGKLFSSVDFARFLEQKMISSEKHVVFIIGGPYGFSEDVYRRAQIKISLSPMTFSHQLIRVIFLEQFYRAMTIVKGEPYHHE